MAKFIVDDPVNLIALSLLGYLYLDTVGLEPVLVEALLHGKTGAEQPHPLDPVGDQGIGGGVGNVQQRDIYRLFDVSGHLVHGIGTQHDKVRARLLNAPGGVGEQPGGILPAALMLKGLDLGEVQTDQGNLGRMMSTKCAVHIPIDDLVVAHRGLPTHAAQQPDGLHSALPRTSLAQSVLRYRLLQHTRVIGGSQHPHPQRLSCFAHLAYS